MPGDCAVPSGALGPWFARCGLHRLCDEPRVAQAARACVLRPALAGNHRAAPPSPHQRRFLVPPSGRPRIGPAPARPNRLPQAAPRAATTPVRTRARRQPTSPAPTGPAPPTHAQRERTCAQCLAAPSRLLSSPRAVARPFARHEPRRLYERGLQGGGGACGRRPDSRSPGRLHEDVGVAVVCVAALGGRPRGRAGEHRYRRRPAASSVARDRPLRCRAQRSGHFGRLILR